AIFRGCSWEMIKNTTEMKFNTLAPLPLTHSVYKVSSDLYLICRCELTTIQRIPRTTKVIYYLSPHSTAMVDISSSGVRASLRECYDWLLNRDLIASAYSSYVGAWTTLTS